MTEVAIPWWNVNLKKLTIGLQLHMPCWAFGYTANGVTMPVQSCMIPWSGQPADMS